MCLIGACLELAILWLWAWLGLSGRGQGWVSSPVFLTKDTRCSILTVHLYSLDFFSSQDSASCTETASCPETDSKAAPTPGGMALAESTIALLA